MLEGCQISYLHISQSMAVEIHIQDENSDDSSRRANLALASTAVCPVVATSFRVARGTAGLGAGRAGSLIIAARLPDALSLRNV